MLQAQYQPQQPFLREPKLLHVRARSRSAQHSRQSDNQNLQQIVSGVLGPRIRQGPESLPEMAHRTPSSIREPPSESSFRANAIGASNAYAIPLPRPPRGVISYSFLPLSSTTSLSQSSGSTSLSDSAIDSNSSPLIPTRDFTKRT